MIDEEFINLKQGNMCVDEYSLKVTMLSRYASSLVSDVPLFHGTFNTFPLILVCVCVRPFCISFNVFFSLIAENLSRIKTWKNSA